MPTPFTDGTYEPDPSDGDSRLAAKMALMLYDIASGNVTLQTSDGGGASTFAALTDKTTADIPAINTPTATALNLRTLNSAAAITGGTITGLTGFGLRSGAAFDLTLATSEALTAGRTLSFNVADGNRTLTIPATGTVALLGTANVFTAAQTITGPVGSSALTITGGTQTASFPVLDLTQTWNNAGVTLTGLKLNITNTASAAASLLVDIQLGGTSQFLVNRLGVVGIGAAYGIRPGVGFVGRHIACDVANSSLGVYGGFGLEVYTSKAAENAGTRSAILQDAGSGPIIGLSSIGIIGWTSSATDGSGTRDTILAREAAAHLTQRNSTTAQIFSVVNTWTSTTNFERFKIDWAATANVARVGTSIGASGTARDWTLEHGNTEVVRVASTGLTVASGMVLKLGNTAASGAALVSTHTVTVVDAAGTTYRLMALV